LKRIRTFFATGLIVLIPLMATVFFLQILFRFLDGFLEPILRRLIGYYIPGLGMITTIAIVFFTGLLATNYFGSRIIRATESLLTRMPLIRGIYGTSKQLVDAFFHPETTPFKHVCMIEYPRKGVYTVGFVTGEIAAGSKDESDMVSIFVAATPNPTFGFYVIVPKHEVEYLDMSIEDGLKLVVSGGIIMPRSARALFKKNGTGYQEEQG